MTKAWQLRGSLLLSRGNEDNLSSRFAIYTGFLLTVFGSCNEMLLVGGSHKAQVWRC